MDFTILANEINTDPLALGYAPFVSSGGDQSIADMLNSSTGHGSATVKLTIMGRGEFLLSLVPAIATLATLSSTIENKWDRLITVACANETIDISSPVVGAILDSAVQDGLLTSQQRSVIGTRTGSRAETLFGAGVVVTHNDIAKALRPEGN